MSAKIPPVLLILGEPLAVRDKCRALVEQVLPGGGGPMTFSRYHGSDGPDEPLNEANTISMMTPIRVVHIHSLERANTELLDALLDYVVAPNPSTVLLLSCSKLPPAAGGVNRGVRLRNALKKKNQLIVFDAQKMSAGAFLRQRSAREGVSLSPGALQQMISLIGADFLALENELEKLICFVGDRAEIQETDVSLSCSPVAETEIWGLTDAIVNRNTNGALTTLHRLLEQGNAPHQLLAMISWQCRQLLEIQEVAIKGLPLPPSLRRLPTRKRELASRVLRKNPLRAEQLFTELVRTNRAFNSARAGERRHIEALILRLCVG